MPQSNSTLWNAALIANSINKNPNNQKCIELLLTKGNTVLKYNTLSLIDMPMLSTWTCAKIITVDDDQTIFSLYSSLIDESTLQAAILFYNAQACAYELTRTRGSQLVNILDHAIKYCLTLPHDLACTKIQDMYNNILDYNTRMDMWANNILMQQNECYRYWSICPPKHTYIGCNQCYFDIKCHTVEQLVNRWESIFRHRAKYPPNAFDNISVASRSLQCECWSVLERVNKPLFTYFTSCMDWTPVKINPGNHSCPTREPGLYDVYMAEPYVLYIPFQSVTQQQYIFSNNNICACNSFIDAVQRLLYSDDDECFFNFHVCTDAISGSFGKSLMISNINMYNEVIDKLYQHWQQQYTSSTKPYLLAEDDLQYIELFPLIENITRIIAIAKEDYIVKSILVKKIRECGSLTIIPDESLPDYFDDIPELITIREFDLYPTQTLLTIEHNRLMLNDDTAHHILEYLLYSDKTSSLLTDDYPIISETTFADFILSLDNTEPIVNSEHFCKNYTYVIYYHLPDCRRLYNNDISIEALKYGLRTYGCAADCLGQPCDKIEELPPITLTGGYTNVQYYWIINLYIHQLQDLYITENVFQLLLLSYNNEFLYRWASLHRGCNFNISQVDLTRLPATLFTILIGYNIIDVHDIDNDTLPDTLKAIMNMPKCSICIEHIIDNDRHETPCGHIFHSTCIMQWLTVHHSCPYCRSVI
jgi:hypothetical protein